MGIEEFADFLTQSVTIEPATGQDSYGRATYGTGVVYKCRISGKATLLTDLGGRQVLARQVLYLNGTPVVTLTDRVTLQAEYTPSQPPILSVNRIFDENGAHHTAVYLG